jgi:hypothetical protein
MTSVGENRLYVKTSVFKVYGDASLSLRNCHVAQTDAGASKNHFDGSFSLLR